MCLAECNDPAEVTKEVIELAVSPAQPFAGYFLEIECKNVVSAKKAADGTETAKVFTRIDPVRVWSRDEALQKIPPATAASLKLT